MFWKNRGKIRNHNVVQELIQKVASNDPQTTKVVLKGVSVPSDLFTALAMALISNTHVKVLYLASLTTPLWPHSVQVMASALVQNSTLETIWLEDNQICSAGAASFAIVLYVNKSIRTIGLPNNLIGNQGALSILSALQGNTTIQSIVLQGNAIKYDLLNQITALAARNTHQDSTMHEAFTKSNHPIKLRNVSNARERGSSKSKTTLDDDHALTNDHSISSISTLETIMEESESEDDDDSVF